MGNGIGGIQATFQDDDLDRACRYARVANPGEVFSQPYWKTSCM